MINQSLIFPTRLAQGYSAIYDLRRDPGGTGSAPRPQGALWLAGPANMHRLLGISDPSQSPCLLKHLSHESLRDSLTGTLLSLLLTARPLKGPGLLGT